MKKVISIILCLIILFVFTACSSRNNSSNTSSESQNITQASVFTDNTITYENISYKVNPLLNNREKIAYVDFEENSKGITVVEIGWNDYHNDDGEGCKDILAMYYNNTLTDVKSGKQNVLGSVYCHRTADMKTEWSYYDADSNLICTNSELNLFDKNNYLIATMSEDENIFYDSNGNKFDVTSLDPFIKTVVEF